MIDSEIREIMFRHSDLVRKYRLSAPRKRIIKYIIGKKSTTSAVIANGLDLSLPSVSTTLGVLYALGYLTRREVSSETGGVEFIYQAEKRLK